MRRAPPAERPVLAHAPYDVTHRRSGRPAARRHHLAGLRALHRAARQIPGAPVNRICQQHPARHADDQCSRRHSLTSWRCHVLLSWPCPRRPADPAIDGTGPRARRHRGSSRFSDTVIPHIRLFPGRLGRHPGAGCRRRRAIGVPCLLLPFFTAAFPAALARCHGDGLGSLGRHLPWVRTQQISTHWIRHTTLTWVERRGVAPDATFRYRREDDGAGDPAGALSPR